MKSDKDILDIIVNFEGKRDSCLTIILPSNSFDKNISKIKRKIFTIKHQSKKNQLLEIINIIEKNHNSIKFKNKNLIICCGMKVSNQIEFYELESLKSIDDLEYYYDYKFYVNRVISLINSNIDYLNIKTTSNIFSYLESKQELIIYEKELNKYLDSGLISCLILFEFNNTLNDSSNALDFSELVKKSNDNNFEIKIYKTNLDSNYESDKIKSNYGKLIGILYYKID